MSSTLRALALFTLAACATAQTKCGVETCALCIEDEACGWYGPMGCDVKEGVSEPQASLLADACPKCQAGSCTDCQAQEGCGWMVAPFLSSHCDVSAAPEAINAKMYTEATECPKCDQSEASCGECSKTPGCAWYEVVAVGGAGECADKKPSGKEEIIKEACNGDPCNKKGCNSCQDVEVCSWYESSLDWKCDFTDNPGVIDGSGFYDKVADGKCGACRVSDCGGCLEEEGCSWFEAMVTGGLGQCAKTSDPPTGFEAKDVCESKCKKFSCSECGDTEGCAWYYNRADWKCDLEDSGVLDKAYTKVSDSAKCPACHATECYDCYQVSTEDSPCTWQVLPLGAGGQCVAGREEKVGHSTVKQDSEDCAMVMTDGAASLQVSVFGFVLAAIPLINVAGL